MIKEENKRILSTLFENGSPINLLICIMWASELFFVYLNGFCNHVPLLRDIKNIVLPLCLVCIILLSIPKFTKCLHYFDYLFYFICLIVYIFQINVYPQNAQVLHKYMFMCCFSAMPYFFIGKVVDIQKLIHLLYIFSLISILVEALYFLLYAQTELGNHIITDAEIYNMHKAYCLVPHAMLVFWFVLQKPRFTNILLFIISCFLLLTYGTRGPILSLLIFITICILFFSNKNKSKLILFVVLVITILIISFLPSIISLIAPVIDSLGLSSRILEKIIDNDMLNDSGRSDIRSQLLYILQYTPDSDFGFGIFGSYFYIDSYPHNIILDFIFTFGYFVGIVLLLIVAAIFIGGVKSAQTQEAKLFTILLIVVVLTKLTFSSTFIREGLFFMALGYCSQQIRNKRINN